MLRPPLLVIMGVSGSGKTLIGLLLAQQLALPFVDADDLHPAANVVKMARAVPLHDEDRWPWLAVVGERLAAASTAGLVVACSSLKRSYRDQLRASAPGLLWVHLTGPQSLLAQRLQKRPGHYMPASLLQSQLDTLEPPSADEGALTCDIRQPPQRIVDALCQKLEETTT